MRKFGWPEHWYSAKNPKTTKHGQMLETENLQLQFDSCIPYGEDISTS
jgi:hypothetical protein